MAMEPEDIQDIWRISEHTENTGVKEQVIIITVIIIVIVIFYSHTEKPYTIKNYLWSFLHRNRFL